MSRFDDHVRVGGVSISMRVAAAWIHQYTDPRHIGSTTPYAFPAYDRYQAVDRAPLSLSDADLLAPVLLNVAPSLRAYYALQRVRPRLEAALAHPLLEQPLAGLSEGEIDEVVGPLYSVLDDPAARPWGVGGTTLSKILHRKRPEPLVLHDQWVRACYVGEGRPVPATRRRTWGDYMTLVSTAIWQDLRTQASIFEQLSQEVRGELSHVRLLDILAWRSRGASPPEQGDVGDEEWEVRCGRRPRARAGSRPGSDPGRAAQHVRTSVGRIRARLG